MNRLTDLNRVDWAAVTNKSNQIHNDVSKRFLLSVNQILSQTYTLQSLLRDAVSRTFWLNNNKNYTLQSLIHDVVSTKCWSIVIRTYSLQSLLHDAVVKTCWLNVNQTYTLQSL